MRGCNAAVESVKVFLTKTFCLPILTYSLGALKLDRTVVKAVGVCWNDAFRKIFGLNRWDSVSCIQGFCNELSFSYIYDLYRWNFLYNCASSCAPVSFLVALDNPELQKFVALYGTNKVSASMRKTAIMKHFLDKCMPAGAV